MSELRAAGEQPDDRPTWDVPHSVTIRCLRAAEDRIRAGESPAEVFADYGWTFAPDGPAEQPQPVARIVSSGPYADMPQLQWLSADHSFRAPIGTLLYPLLPAAPPPPDPQPEPVAICASEIAKIIRHARAGNQAGVESYALLLCDKLDAANPELSRYLRRVIAGDDGERVYPAAPPPPATAELPTPVAWSVAFNGRADTDYTYCSRDAAEGAADYLRAHKAELGPFAVVPLYAAPPAAAPTDAQDAARYRWLRDPKNADRDEWNLFGPYSSPADIDAVIDAALRTREGR